MELVLSTLNLQKNPMEQILFSSDTGTNCSLRDFSEITTRTQVSWIEICISVQEKEGSCGFIEDRDVARGGCGTLKLSYMGAGNLSSGLQAHVAKTLSAQVLLRLFSFDLFLYYFC